MAGIAWQIWNMPERHQRIFEFAEDPQRAANRQTASLAGLAVALALVVAGFFLVSVLNTPQQHTDFAVVSDASGGWQ
jgi:hypothetical protein